MPRFGVTALQSDDRDYRRCYQLRFLFDEVACLRSKHPLPLSMSNFETIEIALRGLFSAFGRGERSRSKKTEVSRDHYREPRVSA